MDRIKVYRLVLGPVATNTYLVAGADGREAFVVDPADSADYIEKCLQDQDLCLRGILLTHGHFDHIGALEQLRRNGEVPVYANALEKETLFNPRINLTQSEGFPISTQADIWLGDDEIFTLAGMRVQMFSTPGHTAGGACYYLEEEKILFSGDTLFQGSVGRTDFPGGNMETLRLSIQKKLFSLPEDVAVCSGHGPGTTIGYEKKYNFMI